MICIWLGDAGNLGLAMHCICRAIRVERVSIGVHFPGISGDL